MCGRYYLGGNLTEDDVKDMKQILRDIDNMKLKSDNDIVIKTEGEIFPTDIVPIVSNNKQKEIKAFPMQWGYKPFQQGGRPLINARSETASEKSMFKKSMEERRCLIPASHYYEWEGQKGSKTRHFIQPIDEETFFMAGLYRYESEKNIPVFTILTRDAAPDIKFIHHRMPVILPEGARTDWLNLDYNADEIIQAAMLDMKHWTAQSTLI